jgi:hypothetical protein
MRILKKIALGGVGGILALYLLFAIGLVVLEWIVRENPKVEESLEAHSTAPHTLTHFDQGAASFHRRLQLIESAKQSIASRKVFNALVEELGRATKEAVVESPDFVIKSGGYAVLEDLHEKGVHVRVLTNSLASTDASYAVAALYPWLGSLADTGLTLSAYGGKPSPGQSTNIGGGSARWGVAHEYRRPAGDVWPGHRARHDRGALGPPRRGAADAAAPLSARDADCQPV